MYKRTFLHNPSVLGLRKILQPLELLEWLLVSLFFGLWQSTVLLFTQLADFFLPVQPLFASYVDPDVPALSNLWRVMSNFDGNHYLAIAQNGYEPFRQAFFPLYPWAIAFSSSLFHLPLIISALLISRISFCFGLYVVYKLFQKDWPSFSVKGVKNTPAVLLFFGSIIFFPTAMFYGAVYNDALFFFLSGLTLLAGRQRKWFVAGICGALATLTRLNGLALWFFLITEFLLSTLDADGWDWRFWWRHVKSFPHLILTPQFFYTLLVPFSFIGYLAYQQWVFGSWRVVFGNMQIWHQEKVTLPPQVLWRYFKILLSVSPSHYQYWVAAGEFGAVMLYIFCIIYSWRKIRLSYWLFVVLSILIPWLTGSFQGMPRYGLHLYPLFLVITMMLVRMPKSVRVIYFCVSLFLFALFTFYFTKGYFVA